MQIMFIIRILPCLLLWILMVLGDTAKKYNNDTSRPHPKLLFPSHPYTSISKDHPETMKGTHDHCITNGGTVNKTGHNSSLTTGMTKGLLNCSTQIKIIADINKTTTTQNITTSALFHDTLYTKPRYLLSRGRNTAMVGVVAAVLGRLLAEVVEKEMKGCNLVVVYDEGYNHRDLLDPLLLLENVKQVVEIKHIMSEVAWVSEGCQGYLVMLTQPDPLLSFTSSSPLLWDYRGRYFFVLPSRSDLEEVVGTQKGRKTENIAGAVYREGRWQVYMNNMYGKTGVRIVGTWMGEHFASITPHLYPDKLSDFHGTSLQAVTFEWAPSVFYYRSRNGSVLFRYGTDIGVLETLAQVLNFTVEYQEPPQGERWGRKEENGSWSGMMGRLARNEVDIGLVDLYVTLIRVGILDYTAPYDSELSCFMARTEPPLPRWQSLAYPFQPSTWLAMLLGLIITGPVLCLLARGSAVCGGEEAVRLKSLSYSCYYSLGLHCCEAQETIPRSKSTRIFVIFLWLYTITLTIAYSTNLTAFLLVSKVATSMETIRDLHGSGLEVSGVGDFYGGALGSASDPYLQSLEERFRSYGDAHEIFPGVLSGRAVMIQNSPFLEFVAATKFTSRGQARMRLMKECFAPFSIAMSVQRHSPLKRKFDQVINWVVAAGLVRHSFLTSLRLFAQNTKELADEVDGGQESEDVQVEGVTSLSLEHLQGIFFIISLGWLVSVFIFCLELVV